MQKQSLLSFLIAFSCTLTYGQRNYTAKLNPILNDCQTCFHNIRHDTTIASIGTKFHFSDRMTDSDKQDFRNHYLVSYDITNPDIDEDAEVNRHFCADCEEFHFIVWRDLFKKETYFQVRFGVYDAYSATGSKTIYHTSPQNNFITIEYADGKKDVLYDLNVYKDMFLVKPSESQLQNLSAKKIRKITCSNDDWKVVNTSVHKIGDTCASYIKEVVNVYSTLSGDSNYIPPKRIVTNKIEEVQAEFISLVNNGGLVTMNFKKSDGSTISFHRDVMRDQALDVNFTDAFGGINEALIGKSFLIQWVKKKEVVGVSNGEAQIELVNKIIHVKQL